MAGGGGESLGPDLAAGIDATELEVGGMIRGHVDDVAVVVVRTSDGLLAIGGRCTHYGGDLGQGLFDGATVRCPRHHARFDVTDGAAVCAPALDGVAVFDVVEEDGRIVVGERREVAADPAPILAPPSSVVIVGAGAAGSAAAEMLRREGYGGPVTMIGAADELPSDRPNLSKDYLAGDAPEDWIPLRSASFYRDRDVELRLGERVVAVDTEASRVTLGDGSEIEYGALLLATGAEPFHPPIPGAEAAHCHYLRTVADSRAIIEAAEKADTVVVVGAGFIGLEVAASLRKRNKAVHVVSPDRVPLAKVMGDDLGQRVRQVHESHGVQFHLECGVEAIGASAVSLTDGTALPADLVVLGVGARPEIGLAQAAGIDVDRGVLVDRFLATSAPGVWAAGDIASWPDPRFGRIRVEHWVVAQRQGQVAARNMLGREMPFDEVPFFWSEHFDLTIDYVGHAGDWDTVDVRADGDAVAFVEDGRITAVATIADPMTNLRAEVAFERGEDPLDAVGMKTRMDG